MPHVARERFHITPFHMGATPVPGNQFCGSCINTLDNRQALYCAYDTSGVPGIKVYKTRAGYDTLPLYDGSVDYQSTVISKTFKTYVNQNVSPSTGLTRIGGTLYCSVAGWGEDGTAGTWIYRDGSGTGDGPWVLHATVGSTYTPSDQTSISGMFFSAGEIVVLSGGRWMTPAPVYGFYSGGGVSLRGGVYTSDDGGSSWALRLNVGWYILGGVFGDRWSRQVGKFDGQWYVGGSGNVDPGKHFKSSDGINWTSIGNLGTAAGGGYSFPLSTDTRITHWADVGVTSDFAWDLEETYTAPESVGVVWTGARLSSYGLPTSSGTYPYPWLGQIGPVVKPQWVATTFGKVVFVNDAGGWTVGKIGSYGEVQ